MLLKDYYLEKGFKREWFNDLEDAVTLDSEISFLSFIFSEKKIASASSFVFIFEISTIIKCLFNIFAKAFSKDVLPHPGGP